MCGKMDANMKVTITSTRSMAKERTPTQMVASIVVSGSMECNTALAASLARRAPMRGKAYGRLENSNSGLILILQKNEA